MSNKSDRITCNFQNNKCKIHSKRFEKSTFTFWTRFNRNNMISSTIEKSKFDILNFYAVPKYVRLWKKSAPVSTDNLKDNASLITQRRLHLCWANLISESCRIRVHRAVALPYPCYSIMRSSIPIPLHGSPALTLALQSEF